MNPSTSPQWRSEYSPLSRLRLLWKKKRAIGIGWLLLSAAAAGIVIKLPARYKADALILIDSQKIPDKLVSSTVNSSVQERISNINQSIMSSTRLKSIIDEFGLYHEYKNSAAPEEVLEMMRKDITVAVDFEHEIATQKRNAVGAFRVSYEGPDPNVVAQVTNRLANLYIEENLKSREVQAEGTAEFLRAQSEEGRKRLEQVEAAVSEFKQKHNGELPEQEAALLSLVSRLQTELQSTTASLAQAQASKMMLESTLRGAESVDSTLAAAFDRRAGESRPQLKRSAPGPSPRKASEILQEQIEILRSRYSEDHPDMKRLTAALESVKEREARQPAPKEAASTLDAGPGNAAGVEDARDVFELSQSHQRVAQLRIQMSVLDKELEARKNDQQRIAHSLVVDQARIDKLPMRQQEMAKLTRDYEISKDNYKSLLDKKFVADMATDMEQRQKSERFTIIDAARVPQIPIKPNRPVFMALGSLAGLLLTLVLVLGTEVHKSVVLGEWELPNDTFILARLPYIGGTAAARGGHSHPSVRLHGRLMRRLVYSSAAMVALAAVAGVYYRGWRF